MLDKKNSTSKTPDISYFLAWSKIIFFCNIRYLLLLVYNHDVGSPPYYLKNSMECGVLPVNPGRFGPIPVRSGRFGPGRFGPISGVSRFGPVGAGRFGPIS